MKVTLIILAAIILLPVLLILAVWSPVLFLIYILYQYLAFKLDGEVPEKKHGARSKKKVLKFIPKPWLSKEENEILKKRRNANK